MKKITSILLTLPIIALLLTIGMKEQVSAVTDPTTAENVYRFLNKQLGSAHFYVIGDNNKAKVEKKSQPGGAWDGAFEYETVAFKAYEFNGSCPSGTVPVYRFLNNQFGSIHFYVVGTTNKQVVIDKSAPGGSWEGAFTYETEAFCVYEAPNAFTVEVARFRNELLGGSVHFYVVGENNKQNVINKSKPGAVWDGVFVYETTTFYAIDPEATFEEPVNEFGCLLNYPSKMLQEVNQYRAQNGKTQVILNESLNTASCKHSVWMSNNNTLNHIGEGGSYPSDRCIAEGDVCSAENIANFPNPDAASIVTAWSQSPAHNENLLGDYSEIGVGVKGGYVTLVLKF
ncbi:MAG: CAP domain-containing protein [Candidatus Dojkabacteria bacterium]|nr:CAP domain-containing protein [Candidatus Dojkabacteria bacterium]MDQ7021571.1 CAP domain-containing protein [Candidatus Dojkabacteria bacterium]